MPSMVFRHGTLILADRLVQESLRVGENGQIETIGAGDGGASVEIDLNGDYLAPGFIDLHVHGGADADFMDGTEEAFRTVCQAHARHGTTAVLATTTVARHEQHLAFFRVCRSLKEQWTGGAVIAGAHFYGPYFQPEACGCHPREAVRPPRSEEFEEYLGYTDCLRTATVAPELPGAREFVFACRSRGIVCNAGHSHATFDQVAEAVRWGVRHVDHLFCAMSDRARLRQSQTYPMRGGLLEATLYFDELTTEVIADGKHLAPELLRLAYKIKGADRLALVTDANRALDMPDGEYIFGPREDGEKIVRRDGVGIMPDGKSLASGVEGLDTGVREMQAATQAPLWEVIRMASLTPARIAGLERDRGSLEPGKRADLVRLDRGLRVRQVWVGGRQVL